MQLAEANLFPFFRSFSLSCSCFFPTFSLSLSLSLCLFIAFVRSFVRSILSKREGRKSYSNGILNGVDSFFLLFAKFSSPPFLAVFFLRLRGPLFARTPSQPVDFSTWNDAKVLRSVDPENDEQRRGKARCRLNINQLEACFNVFRQEEGEAGATRDRENVRGARKHVPLTRQTFRSRSSTDTSLPRIPKPLSRFPGNPSRRGGTRGRKKASLFRSVKEHSVGAGGGSLCSQKTSIGIRGCVLAYVRSSQSYFYVVCLNGYFLITVDYVGGKLSTSVICRPPPGGKYRRNNSSRVRTRFRGGARLEFITREFEGREKESGPRSVLNNFPSDFV